MFEDNKKTHRNNRTSNRFYSIKKKNNRQTSARCPHQFVLLHNLFKFYNRCVQKRTQRMLQRSVLLLEDNYRYDFHTAITRP